MRPKWLKVRKSYQGGTSPDDYIILHPNDNPEEAARSWANKSPGGHNYGWTVHWSPVDSPPVEWIDKKIASLEKRIKVIDLNVKTMEKEKETILKKIEVNQAKIEINTIEKHKMMDDIMEFIRKES